MDLTRLDGDQALAAIASVRERCRTDDGVDPLDEAASLRLRHRGLAGVQAWVEPDGFALRDDDRLDLAVAPQARGRGVGTRLSAAATAAPGALTAWAHTDHPAAARLATRHGFEGVRALWVMRRPTALPLAPSAPPPGVRIRDFGAGDAEALLRVNAAAFADHPEQGGLDADGFAERAAEEWFDPAGLLLAVDADDDTLLGFHWTKRHDARRGEVYVLGIDPAAQGRGLGRVLTVAGLQHLAAHGLEEVVLYVEADNDAARRLYSGLGFTHAATDTHRQYRRRIGHPTRNLRPPE